VLQSEQQPLLSESIPQWPPRRLSVCIRRGSWLQRTTSSLTGHCGSNRLVAVTWTGGGKQISSGAVECSSLRFTNTSRRREPFGIIGDPKVNERRDK
jgi:hypothetical protein